MKYYKSSESILLVVDVQPKTLNDKIIAENFVDITKYRWIKIYVVKWFSDKISTFHLSRVLIMIIMMIVFCLLFWMGTQET